MSPQNSPIPAKLPEANPSSEAAAKKSQTQTKARYLSRDSIVIGGW